MFIDNPKITSIYENHAIDVFDFNIRPSDQLFVLKIQVEKENLVL